MKRAGLIALAVVVYALVPYRWANRMRATDEAAARRARAQSGGLATRIAHARAVASDPAGWSRRLAAVEAAFPRQLDVSGEVAVLRTAAAASGVKLTALTADPPASPVTTNASSPQAIDVHVQVQGPVPGVTAFLARLRASPRLFTTTRTLLDLSPSAGVVTADLTVQMWTWP